MISLLDEQNIPNTYIEKKCVYPMKTYFTYSNHLAVYDKSCTISYSSSGLWMKIVIKNINGNNLYADMKIVPHGNLQEEKTGMTENANKVPGKYYFLNVSH